MDERRLLRQERRDATIGCKSACEDNRLKGGGAALADCGEYGIVKHAD